MAFKIPNFSKQMGGSPFHKKGSPLHDAKFNTTLYGGRSGGTTEKHRQIEEEADAPVVEPVEAPVYSGFGSNAWNNNFTIENGQRVDKYGNTYSDDAEGFASFQDAARAYNSNKKNNNVEVLEVEPVNVEEEVEPIENVVNPNAHVPSEGIQILSGKQRRAAKRVARLRNKAAKKGGLTEGQSKRLNRNIDKAQGDEVAFADRTKVGQVISRAGDALGITPDEEEVV
jgi:hypothetical protein|tara:strand:- start:292 stop:972 length:681 start_codon:yes stop_codon:yes gene_type:complete